MSLVELIDRFDSVQRSIVVVNRTEPDPIHNMLVDTFGDDSVDVIDQGSSGGDGRSTAGPFQSIETLLGDEPPSISVGDLRESDAVSFDGDSLDDVTNLVLLLEGDEIVAASPLAELVEAILLVNSDLYVTGTRGLGDLDLPAVITGLDDTVFTLRGYPESNRQKLLLITISRFIERVAWESGAGTLRSSFQRLSRLDDEIGTRRVYRAVVDAGVDTHVYGYPDHRPDDLGAIVHAGDSADFTDTWFVVYRPPEGARSVDGVDDDLRRGIEGGVALLAVEVEPRIWRGVWTFDPDRIRTVNEYIASNL
ncbi:hypothetical protein [Halorubrum sp. DTA98]|uniref:hypothetical protein n=1 Tax=Halorubrum sp. DTA98 TaxID=3402163 RepID=UPI003AAE019D